MSINGIDNRHDLFDMWGLEDSGRQADGGRSLASGHDLDISQPIGSPFNYMDITQVFIHIFRYLEKGTFILVGVCRLPLHISGTPVSATAWDVASSGYCTLSHDSTA